MSHFDMTEQDEGTGLDSPINDRDGPLVLDSAQDSVDFRFWFEDDLQAVRIRAAVIVQDDPSIVRYVIQTGDLDNHGVLWGQWDLDIVSQGKKLHTFPIRYDVGPLVGP